MAKFYGISSIFLKNSVPLLQPLCYSLTSTPKIRISFLQTFNTTIINEINDQKICGHPSDLPAKSPPDVPTAPPWHKPRTPPPTGVRRMFIKEPEFDQLMSLEEAGDSPPEPRTPGISPPGEPEIVPPGGPDITPPKLPEPWEVNPPKGPTIDIPHGPEAVPPSRTEPGFPNPTYTTVTTGC